MSNSVREKKISFPSWLTQFRRRHNSRGSLARFIRDDLNYPINARNPFDGYEYLISINVDKKIQDAFLDAWNEYRTADRLDTPELIQNCNTHAYYFHHRKSELRNQ